MNRAIVIKTYGDRQIGGAIADGVKRGSKREASDGTREAVRRVAMHQHTPEEWAVMTAKARYDYGQDPPQNPLCGAVMGLWALVWLEIAGWIDYLQRWNRGLGV